MEAFAQTPEAQASALRRVDALSPAFAEEFGTFLLGGRAIDELALQRSQRAARQSGERFDHVLTKLGLVSEFGNCNGNKCGRKYCRRKKHYSTVTDLARFLG